MIIAPRGPRKVLCVVVETTSQNGIGFSSCFPAMSPAMCAMSAKRNAPHLSAIARKRAQSIEREYAENPARIIFGFSRIAIASTSSISMSSVSLFTKYGMIVYSFPEKLSGCPCERCPPWSSENPNTLSPGCNSAI